MLKGGAEEWIFLKKLSTFKGPTVRKLIGAGGGGAKYKKNIRARENWMKRKSWKPINPRLYSC